MSSIPVPPSSLFMCVCVYVCMYVCMCRIHIILCHPFLCQLRPCSRRSMYVHICICVPIILCTMHVIHSYATFVPVHVCMHACMYSCMYVHVCVARVHAHCVGVYMYACIYTNNTRLLSFTLSPASKQLRHVCRCVHVYTQITQAC